MKDVAREAGVSLGTVSNYFNGNPVREANRQRVEEAVSRLNYQVNASARALKTDRTECIALLMPSIRHPFFAALTDEITDCLMQRGFRNNLMITNFDSDAEKKSFQLAVQHKIDGIIGLTYHEGLEVDLPVPFVTIDRNFHSKIPCVSSDNYGGGQLAAEKLLELGCKSLLFFRIDLNIYGEVQKREFGFENVCRERGVKYELVTMNESQTESPFYEYLMTHMKDGVPEYDGIFCNSDLLANHIADFLKGQGIGVPETVQIIGYDGVEDFYTGRLTCSTIVQPIREMAKAAVDIVLNTNISNYPACVILPVRYAPGGTTKDSV